MVGIVLGVIILALIIIGIFAKRLTFPTSITYWGIGVVLLLIVWALPNFVDTATFYDYLINTIIVVAGTLIISISIGCLSAYGLARYTGIAGVVILIAALAISGLAQYGTDTALLLDRTIAGSDRHLPSGDPRFGCQKSALHDLDVAQLFYGYPA